VSNEYLPDVLSFVLGHVPQLPRIVMPGEVAFTTSAGLLIACGAGDNAAAALGVGASAGDVVVSLGTSGTVFAVSATPTTDPTGTIAGFASATGDSLPLVCTLNAARVLDSFCRLFDVTHVELGNLALKAPSGAEGVVLVPFFEGERTPNLPNATAQLHGLRLSNNTQPNIARAAIEGMLCGLKGGLDALIDAGVECSRVFLVGGAANNVAVQQIAGEVFGVPVVVPEPGEYVAQGASAQAAEAVLGHLPNWPRDVSATIDTPGVAEISANYARALNALAAAQA
jgi:xylulokinase